VELLFEAGEGGSCPTGIGEVRGHLWRPFARLRCGLAVSLEGEVPAVGACAARGEQTARAALQAGVPGLGGQPGPGIGDMQRVRPGLFISGGAAARLENLERAGVTAVLRLGASFVGPAFALPEGYLQQVVEIGDSPGEQHVLAKHLDSCLDFVSAALEEGRGVLVHCGAGVSRSGAVLCAYLMRAEHLRYAAALEEVRKARQWVRPNDGFAAQLRLFEARLEADGRYEQP